MKNRSVAFNTSAGSNNGTQIQNLSIQNSSDSFDHQEPSPGVIVDIITPTFSPSFSTQYQRAMLVDTSSSTFGVEIEQEQYCVIIFTTRLERKDNLTIHDANSQMMLEWTLLKQSKK